jgi:hypothetical protein
MSVLSIPQYNSNVGTSFTSFSHLIIEIHIQQEINPSYFILEHAGAARLEPTLLRGDCSAKERPLESDLFNPPLKPNLPAFSEPAL